MTNVLAKIIIIIMDSSQNNSLNSAAMLLALIYKIILVYIDTILGLFRPTKKKSIKGQNVLITGAGHGLGRELAHKFAEEGANLVLVDINEANNEKVRQEIINKSNKLSSSSKLKVMAYSADIREEKNVARLAKQIQADLGDIDILVNNAGIVQCLPFLELTPALVERTFQVNTLAHVWTVRHFLPSMIKNNRGHVVAISSIAGLIANKYLTDYCASKFAVVGLMEALDREFREGDKNSGVHFTTVCPVSISTGMFQTFTSRFSWLLPVLNASQVADDIIAAILTNQKVKVIPPLALFFHRVMSGFLPHRVNELLHDYMDYGVKPHTK